MKFLLLNGPNINLLGVREPAIYGSENFAALLQLAEQTCQAEGIALRCAQSNHEGTLVDEIQSALGDCDGIIINPGAYTHTSIALLDAVKAVALPTVEVHISDVAAREAFRQVSYIRAACIATITGEGIAGYAHAIRLLKAHIQSQLEKQ